MSTEWTTTGSVPPGQAGRSASGRDRHDGSRDAHGTGAAYSVDSSADSVFPVRPRYAPARQASSPDVPALRVRERAGASPRRRRGQVFAAAVGVGVGLVVGVGAFLAVRSTGLPASSPVPSVTAPVPSATAGTTVAPAAATASPRGQETGEDD